MLRISLCLLFFVSTLRLSGQAPVTAIKAARMFDGKGDRLIEPGLVVVSGGRIQSVGGSAPAGAKVIDLGDATLLPGFIDAHTHLTMDFDLDYNGARLKGLSRTTAESAIRATVNARKTLMAGFTTVRDLGSEDFLDVGLRNSINDGVVPGPRMLVSVHALGGTGGHCDEGAGFKFGLLNHESGPMDGVINSAGPLEY
jgi:imidazolonepropionase-like amidohydrolase